MNKWLDKPWMIRIVSLLLAVLLFVVVAFDENVYDDNDGFDSYFGTTNETQTLEDIPVRIILDEEEYVVGGVPESVKVTLQGSASKVTSTATRKNFDVFVDLEGLGTGTHTVPLEYSGIGEDLNVYVEPKEVEVSIEERATEEFSVNIDVVNKDQIEAGYEVVNVSPDPGQIVVTSSKSIVDNIAIIKGFVDVAGASESFSVDDVPVKVYDNQGNELNVRIDPPTVDVEVELASPNKTVPISMETENELPEGVNLISMELESEEVQVFAAEDYLATLEQISTQPIDLSKITESGTVEVNLNVPSEVRKVSTTTVNASIEIEKVEEQVIEDVPIEIEGEPEDTEVAFTNPASGTMNVTVSGYPSVLSEITPSDLRLFVTMEGQEVGEFTLPIRAELPDDIADDAEIELAINEATLTTEP